MAKHPPTADLEFTNHGTIITVEPLTEAGKAWIADNIPSDAQKWQGAICMEPRYAWDIYRGALNDGIRCI